MFNNIPFIGPLVDALAETAYLTLSDVVQIVAGNWDARSLDPETPIYDQLCREMGPPFAA